MQLENSTYEVLHPFIRELKRGDTQIKACFLLTHVPNPRINKRIDVFKKEADTKVICSRRSIQDLWEPAQDVEHIILDIDLPSASHLVRRWLVSRKFQKRALAELELFRPDVIYSEGLDCLIIAGKYKKRHAASVVFEVADLRENYIVKPKRLSDRILTAGLLHKEKKAFRDVDRLVVTSPRFYDVHYCELIGRDRLLFIPNAPDPEAFKTYRKKTDGRFTVGFIGGIRYLDQMKMLADAARAADCDVLFAGAGGSAAALREIQAYCEKMPNVTFTGRYDYDREIAGLYGRVDCVFSVYDADNPNVRIALPNKLYEAILCRLPIIVAKNTYLAELVEELGVGLAVDHRDAGELTEALRRLKNDRAFRDACAENCRRAQGRSTAQD